MEGKYPIERMDRPFRAHIGAMFVTAWVIGASLCRYSMWVGVPIIAVSTPLLIWYDMVHVRCPRCNQRTRSRQAFIEGRPFAQRVYYDCHHCRTTWDPDIVITD